MTRIRPTICTLELCRMDDWDGCDLNKSNKQHEKFQTTERKLKLV